MRCPRGRLTACVLLLIGAGSGPSRSDQRFMATAVERGPAQAPARPQVSTGTSPVTPDPSLDLLDAVAGIRPKEVQSILANQIDQRILNEALLRITQSEPMIVGQDGQKAADGEVATIGRLLIEKGAAIEARDEWGHTPLQLAASAGVKLQLERGADVRARNKQGQTALDVAIQNHWKQIAGHLRGSLP